MADITMPQLGETVTEGTITRWLKQVGDKVEPDELLFEVSTDKVDSEVPSPAGGVLTEILVAEGDTVDVGTRIAVISDGAAAPASAPTPEQAAAPAPAAPEAAAPAEPPAPAATEAGPEEEAVGQAVQAEPAGTPEPAEPEPAAPASSAVAEGDAAEGDAAEGDAGDRDAGASDAGARDAGGGRVLSPVVRKLLHEHGIDAATITGTGAGGRITRADVLAVVEGGGGGKAAAPVTEAPPRQAAPSASPAPAPPVPAPTAPPAPRPAPSPVAAGADDEVVPYTNIRRRTAEHMVRSKQTSPHVLVAMEVDFENVDRVRRREKDAFKQAEGISLTYLPFVARAVVDVLKEFPRLNASAGEDALIVHRHVHLGIAVDLSFEGLIVPVVHDADGKRLRGIAREVAELAERARSKKLTADDIAGGTFTITNPGPFGTLLTAPVINQPQVAILSTDGVKRRPVAVQLPDGGEAIVVHPVGNLALSFDHRVNDGAYCSAFLNRMREVLETRDWSTEVA